MMNQVPRRNKRQSAPSPLEGCVGVAMVIFNEYFDDEQDDLQPLSWTRDDANQVKKCFEEFKYFVSPGFDNVRTSQQLFDKFNRIALLLNDHFTNEGIQSISAAKCNRIFVYFSGHGGVDKYNRQFLMLGKGEMVKVDDLIAFFTKEIFADVVKMFFVDACSLKTAENVTALTKYAFDNLHEVNVLVASATSLNFPAYQEKSGSRWTSCLVQAFQDSSENDSVYDILTATQNLMMEKNQLKDLPLQVPGFTSTLITNVKFKGEAHGLVAVLDPWDQKGQMEPKLKFAMTERMTGVEAVSKLSCRVAMVNEKAWSRNEKDTWPPDQSHQFTPLLLVHHKDQQREDQAAIVAQIVCKGDVNPLTIEELVHADHGGNDDSASNVSKLTKELTEILAPLEESDDTQFILIEGAPGIGKSVLLREIAYRWSKKQLLQKFTLVLLVCLRDQFVQEVAYISDLLLPFCKGEEKAKEIATNSSEFLSDTGGKHLLFLLDGFDEFPENLRNDSLIADILNRNVLPRCGLIISSRPHVSVELRNQATIKVDILGFTPKEQRHYIEKSLEGKRDTIEKLTHYLQDNLTISNLCLVPFNMVILLFLHKIKNHLPSNATELYDLFICLTICRHLAKNKLPFNTIKCLSDLPQPCKKVVQQVSKLALEALNENKLVFTDREIKAACPDVTTTPEAINAFGLLQAVQHFGLTGETTTFNFLHLSIQEYLAAHYFKTDFQHEEELRFLHKYFWSDRHANMFAIYIMLTKGQKSSFKKFLSDGNDGIAISNKFLSDQLKCFHLYFYFKEAKDDRMCKSIEEAKIFSKQKIHLASTKLSATDLEHMSVFLTTSMQKQWWELNLHSCNIQDCELHIINNYLNHSDTSIKIERLYLNNNYLTRLSSSYISNIVVRCKVQVLSLSGNKKIGQSGEIYSMLTNPSSVLAVLYMSYTTLSSVAVGKLFAAVKDTNVLKSLTIEHCGITDDAAKDITTALSINKSLARLRMDGNEISGEVILKIIQALSNNDVLQHLHVPGYSRKIGDKIRSMEQNINDGRKSQGVQTQLIVYLL